MATVNRKTISPEENILRSTFGGRVTTFEGGPATIPEDRELWKTENYIDFLAARRELIAIAMTRFLKGL